MNVLHVIPSLSVTQGGPSFALPLIERALAAQGVRVTVVTTDDDGPGRHLPVPLGRPVLVGGATRYYFRKQTEFYKGSLPLWNWLARRVPDFDLVHIHALFSFASMAAATQARRHRVPYVIRPLGVLNRYGVTRRRRGLKQLSLRFIEGPLLRHAAAMHYTSRAEQREAQESGATAPAFVIPLGIEQEVQPPPGPEIFFQSWPQTRGREIILFLSRLDAKKGLDLLLSAFAEVKPRHPRAMLVIAGDGEPLFKRQLHAQMTALGLDHDVVWPGFLSGAQKLSALAAARLFVLPSHSENFGIVLVEAMAAGLPCLTTDGVALAEDIRECDAGIIVPAETKPLAAALHRLLADPALCSRLGANARRLAAERFTVGAMGLALRKLYEHLLSSREKDRPHEL